MTAPRFHRIVTIERFIVGLIVEAVRARHGQRDCRCSGGGLGAVRARLDSLSTWSLTL
jgi:hypothetical protein